MYRADGFYQRWIALHVLQGYGYENQQQQGYSFQEADDAQPAVFGFKQWCDHVYLKYGLCESGENGHGIAMRMMSNASENQISCVRNLSRQNSFLFDTDEPIVNTMIAMNISIM